MEDKERIVKALDLIDQYASIDGDHHKQWLLARLVWILTGDRYNEWVRAYEDGEDGPNTYEWDEGIAP